MALTDPEFIKQLEMLLLLAKKVLGGSLKADRKSDKKGSGWIMVVILVFAILAPFIARLVQLAASRKREFLADATGAKLTRYPKGLASALRKIKSHNRRPMKVDAATAHMFFVNPFAGKALKGLFSTHPPIDKRISILEKM